MNRYYYTSDDLDVLEHLQDDLESRGVDELRIHVMSDQDNQIGVRRLHEVDSLSKKDWVRSGLKGALVGMALAFIILIAGLALGLMDTVWAVPILFLAVVILGFCTWEGGLIGAHNPHPDVKRFQEQLRNGQHVLYVDINDNEKSAMEQAISAHPQVRRAGTGKSEPGVISSLRQSFRDAIHSLP